MSPASPATLSMLPGLCFSSTSLSLGCFRSSSGNGSVTTSSGSFPDLQILTIVVRSSTLVKPVGPFSSASLLVSASQPFLCLVQCIPPEFAVLAYPWRCTLVGQPSGSGTVPSPVFFGCPYRDGSPDAITAWRHSCFCSAPQSGPTHKTAFRVT
jgi:hypothetical protein